MIRTVIHTGMEIMDFVSRHYHYGIGDFLCFVLMMALLAFIVGCVVYVVYDTYNYGKEWLNDVIEKNHDMDSNQCSE